MKKIFLVVSALILVTTGGIVTLFADKTAPDSPPVPVVVSADTDQVEHQDGDQSAPDNGTSEQD